MAIREQYDAFERKLCEEEGLLIFGQEELRSKSIALIERATNYTGWGESPDQKTARLTRQGQEIYYMMAWRATWSGRVPRNWEDLTYVTEALQRARNEGLDRLPANLTNASVTMMHQPRIVSFMTMNQPLTANQLAIVMVLPSLYPDEIKKITTWQGKRWPEVRTNAQILAEEKGLALIPFLFSDYLPEISCPLQLSSMDYIEAEVRQMDAILGL